jgi:hypothetical protein
MYLVCKYGPFKRSQSQQPAGAGDRPQQLPHRLQNQDKESRKQKEAADKELEHLNHKIVSDHGEFAGECLNSNIPAEWRFRRNQRRHGLTLLLRKMHRVKR